MYNTKINNLKYFDILFVIFEISAIYAVRYIFMFATE